MATPFLRTASCDGALKSPDGAVANVGCVVMSYSHGHWVYQGRWSISTLPPQRITPTLCTSAGSAATVGENRAATAAPAAASTTCYKQQW